MVKRRCDLQAKFGSVERIAIRNQHVDAVAKLPRIGVGLLRREIDREEADPGQKAVIQKLGKRATVDPWCA